MSHIMPCLPTFRSGVASSSVPPCVPPPHSSQCRQCHIQSLHRPPSPLISLQAVSDTIPAPSPPLISLQAVSDTIPAPSPLPTHLTAGSVRYNPCTVPPPNSSHCGQCQIQSLHRPPSPLISLWAVSDTIPAPSPSPLISLWAVSDRIPAPSPLPTHLTVGSVR